MADYSLGTAKGRIEIDASGATRGVSQAERAVTGFTGTAAKGHPVLRAFGTGMTLLGAAGAAAVGFGVKLASDMQQAEVAFTQFLGSAEKGRAFLEDLQQFAAQTPFEFPQLRDAASRLLGAGVAADDILPVLTSVGDAVSAIGGGAEQIDRATLALTQMQLKGRVTGEEMLQLTEAGIPSWKILAEAMGTDVASAQEAVTKGQVEINTLFDALKTGAVPSLQAVSGMMEKQSQTLAGLFSTLKDTVGLALVDIAQPLVEGLTKAMPLLSETITDVMSDIGPVFADVLAQLLKLIARLLPAIAPLAKVFGQILASAIKGLIPVVKALTPALIELAGFLGEIARVAGETFAQALKLLLPLLVQLLDALLPLLPPLLELFKAIMPLIPLIVQLIVVALKPLIPIITQLVQWLAQLIEWVASVVRAFTGWVKESEGVKKVGTFFQGVFRVIGAAMRAIFNVIKTVWNAVKGFIQPIISAIVNFIKDHWNTIKTVTLTIWNAIKGVVKTVINAIKTVIQTAFNTIRTIIRTGWDVIKGIFRAAWEALKTIVIGPINFIVDKIQWLIDKAAAAIQWLKDLFNVGIDLGNDPAFTSAVSNLVQAQLPPNPVAPPGGLTSPGGGHSGSHVDARHMGPASVAGFGSVVVDVDGVALTQMVQMHSRRMRVRLGGRR